MQAFLGGFSSAFANELWSFLASGLSVQGHDNAVFGEAGTGDLHGTGNVQGTRGLTPLGFTESPEGSRDGTDRARNEDERLSDRDGDGDGVGTSSQGGRAQRESLAGSSQHAWDSMSDVEVLDADYHDHDGGEMVEHQW